MPQRPKHLPKHLIVGSTEDYSGKSAVIVGLAHRLEAAGLQLAYGKPLEAPPSGGGRDEDSGAIASMLNLPAAHLRPSLAVSNRAGAIDRLQGKDTTNYTARLHQEYLKAAHEDLVLIEGPATPQEGSLFGLSLGQIARELGAQVILVSRYDPTIAIDRLLDAQQGLGDRLLGAVLNAIPPREIEDAVDTVKPFLERQGIPVLGLLPRNNLLRSVSVAELVRQLEAEVICCRERLDLMVEDLKIGAMNVNSALKYFRKGNNMAIVTGGDRTDIQLAALETSTHCLILTGQMPPDPEIISRAEDLEVPILSVNLDTLTTVEIVDRAFGQVRLQEPAKIQCVRQLIQEHFDFDRFLAALGLTPAAA